jgi:hypothetical protein
VDSLEVIRMSIRGRERGELKMFAILVSGLALVVAAYVGFVLAFVEPIPGELWVGFGIVVVVAAGVAGAAAWLVFGSDRPSIEPVPAATLAADHVLHLVVVANETIGSEELRQVVCERASGCESEILVVAPALNTPIRHWADEEDRARGNARSRLDEELSLLARLGVQARGEVGADDPLQAIADTLRTFPADEIIISTHPEGQSNWLEDGVVESARKSFGLPVTHVRCG